MACSRIIQIKREFRMWARLAQQGRAQGGLNIEKEQLLGRPTKAQGNVTAVEL
jgi:hypothetical protein